MARHKAMTAGENEGLLIDNLGNVREGATSNLFVVREGKLVAPPDEDILTGVTLTLVLNLAQAAGLPTCRQPIPLGHNANVGRSVSDQHKPSCTAAGESRRPANR